MAAVEEEEEELFTWNANGNKDSGLLFASTTSSSLKLRVH
jgi:hypothetical protein